MVHSLTGWNIVLASTSLRRKEFLTNAGFIFKVVKPDFEEKPLPNEKSKDYVVRNAKGKALSVIPSLGTSLKKTVVISADTIVVLDDQILEKPVDFDDACRMLTSLSGRSHQVLSGLSVFFWDEHGQKKESSQVVTTDVTMKPLSQAEISAYCKLDEPYDKSGSYAIQGAAAYMVHEVHGSFTNVAGLPMSHLSLVLEELMQ